MKVNEGNPELLDYSKKLDNRLRNENAKKELEIKKISQIYDTKIEAAKSIGQDKYINTLGQNDELLLTAASDYETKINAYKDNLAKTKTGLENESTSLRGEHHQVMADVREQHAVNLQDKFNNAKMIQEDVNKQMNDSITSINDKSKAERRSIENAAGSSIRAVAQEYNAKGAAEEREYRTKLTHDVRLHEEEVKQQQSELKAIALKNNVQNKRLISEKDSIQKEELLFLDNHQKDVLNQKQTDFKVRYENLVKEHNGLIADLKTHFEADVKKMVEESAVKKQTIVNKSQDSFYKVETLSPKIIENEKEYMVSLEVPAHEKENVHLSARGRGVKMTLTRRFTDTFEDKDGSTNRSTKNELFSREFPSKDILDPKSVDQKYENGVLTFRVLKL